jgi:DNA-binding Lrp family transcriptional regulator
VFDTTPEIIKENLKNLKEIGVLRQLSAIFDTRKLGYTSSLVAMEIEDDKLDYVASQINRHPGVSHNYERDHQFNLWFTLAVPPGTDLNAELEKFNVLKGIKKVRMLPTLQLFKIGVKLDMVDDKKHDIAPTEEKKEIKNIKFEPTEQDKDFIRELQKDMEITDEPFVIAAKNLGITEDELFAKMKHYEDIGVMRRFAAILRHRQVGFTANGMIVWKVPKDRITSVGSNLIFLISFFSSVGAISCFLSSTMSSLTPILNNCKVGSIRTFLIPLRTLNFSSSAFKSVPGGTAKVNQRLN